MSSYYSYVFGVSQNGNQDQNQYKDQYQDQDPLQHESRMTKEESFQQQQQSQQLQQLQLLDLEAQETTSLLMQQEQQEHTTTATTSTTTTTTTIYTSKSATQQFFFHDANSTIQRYYRFIASSTTPFCALHKRPATEHGVTGLLRRSAVLPSHGTDPTGEWILVSVGGRSGWARKSYPAGFTHATQFTAKDGWMGNHIFVCQGKIMLGSDAPLFFFTNALVLVGIVVQYIVLLPNLEDGWMTVTQHYYWTAILGAATFLCLWLSATMDPGILPAMSSPIKPPPPQGESVGGPLGYKYCSTCNIFRPPRSKHCNSCNVCVSQFDQ
jgi:DHHC palmitoyltransferase